MYIINGYIFWGGGRHFLKVPQAAPTHATPLLLPITYCNPLTDLRSCFIAFFVLQPLMTSGPSFLLDRSFAKLFGILTILSQRLQCQVRCSYCFHPWAQGVQRTFRHTFISTGVCSAARERSWDNLRIFSHFKAVANGGNGVKFGRKNHMRTVD